MKRAMVMGILLMAFALTPTFAQQATEPTWVMMHGKVTKYGSRFVNGWCGAYAKIDEWAKAHAFWLPVEIAPGSGGMGDKSFNFKYSFYLARLINASLVKLNYTGNDFYISGKWNVYNVTFGYHGDWKNFTKTVEIIKLEAPGELSVTGNWKFFTISITGIELISGEVVFYRITSMKPIPIGDQTGPNGIPDREVDIYDLVHTAKSYGCTPGMQKFDFSMDFNLDFTIDIYDLTTIAANLGEKY